MISIVRLGKSLQIHTMKGVEGETRPAHYSGSMVSMTQTRQAPARLCLICIFGDDIGFSTKRSTANLLGCKDLWILLLLFHLRFLLHYHSLSLSLLVGSLSLLGGGVVQFLNLVWFNSSSLEFEDCPFIDIEGVEVGFALLVVEELEIVSGLLPKQVSSCLVGLNVVDG
ncbi:hypothetical protein QYF36_013330 [Acer negundo]|nr:hypothetical protein QYF36_013330 [Acer negundo]